MPGSAPIASLRKEGVLPRQKRHGAAVTAMARFCLLETCAAHELLITNQLCLLPSQAQRDLLDAPPLKTPAPTGAYVVVRRQKGQTGRQGYKGSAWCRVLD